MPACERADARRRRTSTSVISSSLKPSSLGTSARAAATEPGFKFEKARICGGAGAAGRRR